jgi:hypothetical protein
MKTTNNNNPTVYSYHNKASYYQEWSDRRLAWERRAWTFMEGVHAGVNSSQWELTYSQPVHLYRDVGVRGTPERVNKDQVEYYKAVDQG